MSPSDSRPEPPSPPDPPADSAPDGERVEEPPRSIAELPEAGLWDTLYGRRSIRRFLPDPVPRELIERVLHAGIWAPSSCNYQMWDVVAVDDPELNAELGKLSTQLANAPVNLIVSYGREFSTEGWANIQSASAMIQNMSLAAHALGLGTFWITQLGDREAVRERVGLPRDRLVIAALALGYAKRQPKAAPPRRPLTQVAHYNRYAGRAIPSSVDPRDWSPELLAIYQRARVLNGLRHNKPRPWETDALSEFLEVFVPEGRPASAAGETPPERWLDVLPCTGIVIEKLSRERPGYSFDVVERTPEVAAFAAGRTRPAAGIHAWPDADSDEAFPAPPENAYRIISCLFRLEGIAPGDRAKLVASLKRWLAPGGRILVGYVNRRSFHGATESLRRRRGGPGGVEYVLSPDPSIGPFEALAPGEIEGLFTDAGLAIERRLGLQALPPREEIAFRTRNFSGGTRSVVGALARALGWLRRVPGVESRRGRFQFFSVRG